MAARSSHGAPLHTQSPISLHHMFGVKGDVTNNIHFINEMEVLYPCGHRIVSFNIEKKIQVQRFIQGDTRNGNSEITALAFHHSSKHRYLAVAESGDRAVIWVYDLNQLFGDQSHTPRHPHKAKHFRYKVTAHDVASRSYVSLSFSPDGKQLVAQGGAPDWTLVNFLWHKNRVLQYAQVSDPNGAAIHQVSYHPTDPSTVCVTGDGILRFLRLEPAEFKSISYSMGKREFQNYLSHAWLDDRILIGTDTGELLVFENAEFRGVLPSSPQNGESINSISTFSKGFVCGCDKGVLHVFELDENELFKESKSFQIENNYVPILNLSISPSEDNLICTLANNQAFLLNLSNTDILKAEEMHFDPLSVSFHNGQITGLDVCLRKPLVASSSVDHSVRVWNYEERTLEVVHVFEHEQPYCVAIHPSGHYLLVGLSESVKLMNLLVDDVRTFHEVPVKRCREASFSNGGQYFALAKKELIQVYGTFSCQLICVFSGHKARVNNLRWKHDDSGLVSCGIDGMVIEWSLLTGQHERIHSEATVNFTSCATHSDLSSDLSAISGGHDVIYAVGSDRKMRLIADAKAGDVQEVPLSSTITEFAIPRHMQKVLYAGTETGVLRVYRVPMSTEQRFDYQCHSAAITHVRVSPDDEYVFTGGADGVIAIFKVDRKDLLVRRKEMLPWADEMLMTRADIEEKLTQIRALREQVDLLRLQNANELKKKEEQYKDKLAEVTERYSQELEADKQSYAALEESRAEMEQQYIATLERLETKNSAKLTELTHHFQDKVATDQERIRTLHASIEDYRTRWDAETSAQEEEYRVELERLDDEHRTALLNEQKRRRDLEDQKEQIAREFDELKQLMEEDADTEIDELKRMYDEKLTVERMHKLELKDENVFHRQRFETLKRTIENVKEEIREKNEEQYVLSERIRNLERECAGQHREIHERQSTINDKVKRIYELKKKNQELEKFKFVLRYKIKELKRQIEPSQRDIIRMKEQKKEMQEELDEYSKLGVHENLRVRELSLKLKGMENEIRQQEAKHAKTHELLKRIRADLLQVYHMVDDGKALKEGLKRLYQIYVVNGGKAPTSTPGANKKASSGRDPHTIYQRHRAHLERSVDVIKTKLRKDQVTQEKDSRRIVQENLVLMKEINELRREIQLIRQHRQHDQQNMRPGKKANVWQRGRGSRTERNRAREANNKMRAAMAAQRKIEEQAQQIRALQRQLELLREQP